jgi:tetratricopeptide (TPR) repeat protein
MDCACADEPIVMKPSAKMPVNFPDHARDTQVMPATLFLRFLFRWIILPIMVLGGCSFLENPTPRSALNYFRDGNTAYQMRDYPTAIWNYRQAIVLDDETLSFHYNLGLTYFQSGDYERALDSFENVLEMKPDQADAHYNTALVYYRMRNSDKANRHYNRYQILIQQQSPGDSKPVAKTEAPTRSAPQRPVSAVAGATPPPEMIQQVKQQLQQQLNANPGAQVGGPTAARLAAKMNTSTRRPVPSGPVKTSIPGWD